MVVNYKQGGLDKVNAWFSYHLYLQTIGRRGHVVDFVAGYNAALHDLKEAQNGQTNDASAESGSETTATPTANETGRRE